MKTVRIVALFALGFLSISAAWGAVLLIADPSGVSMKMPVSVLEHSPFDTFLIPGILLLVSSGVLGAVVFVMALVRARAYGWWVAIQGCVLFGWITIEVVLLREIVWLHYVYWSVGLLLIACGWALRRQKKGVPAKKVHTVRV